MTRRVVQVERGLLRIEQHLHIPGVEIGTDVSGPACIYAVVQVRRGAVAYHHGDDRVGTPRQFALFLPPFEIVQASLERCAVTSIALAFRPEMGDDLPPHAVLLSAEGDAPPSSRADALGRLRAATPIGRISRAREPSPGAARAKDIIDREYGGALAMGRIAARLRTAPAVLSRMFKHAYGMPPIRYRHHVRVMDALAQFAEGAAPAAVFQNVGFDDLSRFYKIFTRVTCAPPGAYRPAKSRIAKT